MNVLDYCLDKLENGINEDAFTKCIYLLKDGDSSPGEQFIQAYILEHSNPREAFKLYKELKDKLFWPACFRISMFLDDDETPTLRVLNYDIEQFLTDDFKDLVLDSFEETSNPKYGRADYCLGVSCFMGLDFPKRKDFGLKLIVDSATRGCKGAQRVAFHIFDSEEGYIDKEKALVWLEKIIEFDSNVAVNLANRYIDGVGTPCCEENDKKAYSILSSKEDSFDRTAVNNLGWLYKNGRGCEKDYTKARLLFERAAEMGCATSFYHLGDIFENGLGVDANIELSKKLYEEAAKMDNSKAKERLKNLLDI